MRKLTLFMLACCAMAASAQDVPVNREKYPDYVDPRTAYKPEPRLMKYVQVEGESQSRAVARAASDLPEYWNNADTKYFPPAFNQQGGSCGSASRIGYMFTHEINALRDLDASLPENQYPTHFVWLHTNTSDGKDQFVEFVGVPNVVHYGGRTYSELFGYQEESNNYFGWMTGYDKWMNAIGNRMMKPTSMPQSMETEAGRTAAKMWLYNHAGDTDFKAGGLIGLGVASGGQWYDIPKTAANDAAGVTGKYYVHRWGTQVDHAVTMVGWDDRIEFDLDGNGVAGELDKDEKGAWIIVNSWGNWCNDGFIYCPYKYAGPVSDPATGAMKGGYWWGELYHARKNFRPLRVIKLKMDYTHRSELFLQVGISTDLNATEPEAVSDMHHFRYAGDGNNGNTNPAPAIPMLGKWKNEWHEEPMEFCYDVTDFSNKFDTNKPLKYFFIINRKKATNTGYGNVYDASILDLEQDLDGIETPFDLGGEKFEITKEGNKLMISTIVYGKGYEPVNNLSYAEGTLSWDLPNKGSYQIVSYNIYKDGALAGNTTELSYAIEGGQEYGVSVLYADGTESAKATCASAVQKNNVAVAFENAGFTIPNVFASHYDECTIEFFIKPTMFLDWNNAAGPGWGTYMHHFNANGRFTCGWNTNARVTSDQAFTLNAWSHVALVFDNNKITMYKNGAVVGTATGSGYSGLGGFGNLVFNSNSSNNSWQNAVYDEIRIWDHARTLQQIKGSTYTSFRRQEFYGDVLPQGLLAYYKGDTFQGEDGNYYMRDCVGGNHASIQAAGNPQVEDSPTLVNTPLKATLEANPVSDVYAGIPVALTATRSEGVNKMWWTIPSCGIVEKCVESPVVTFTEVGTHTATVYGLSYKGDTLSSEVKIEVIEPAALDPAFTMSAQVIPCSEHLSLVANQYIEACSYEWILPGAEVEHVYGAKAGATYVADGEYTVTLKMTTADGRTAESSQTVSVTAVAPLADFVVTDPVVLKETPVQMNSTSRYGATAYEWTLDGQAQKTTITPGNKEQVWVPKYPGKYNISLKASNAIGDNTVTKERALIVTNDDSKNGLSFSREASRVTLTNVPATLNEFTVEFWANPTRFSTNCWGFGDSEETLLLKVGNYGEMSVCINGTVITSEIGYFIANEWNHYAIQRTSSGAIRFMRNGVLVKSYPAQYKGEITGIKKFAIGGVNTPVIGVIDEFRLWGKFISNVKDLCNQHMENPEAYVASDNLLAYYDFNQSGGDVIDRSGNGNTGVRTGFGPDGDAWGLSKGVFSLYFGEKLPNETVTAVEDVWQDEPVSAGRKGVYTLSGQYVGTTVKGLPAGMYIVDGKKVALK